MLIKGGKLDKHLLCFFVTEAMFEQLNKSSEVNSK